MLSGGEKRKREIWEQLSEERGTENGAFETETYSNLFLKNNSVRSLRMNSFANTGRGGSSALGRPPCILCYPSSISVCLSRENSTPPHAGRIGDFPRFLTPYSPPSPPLDLFDRFQRSTAYCFSLSESGNFDNFHKYKNFYSNLPVKCILYY